MQHKPVRSFLVYAFPNQSPTPMLTAIALLTTTQTQNQVQSALLLDVVVRQSSSILELLSSEDQALLVRRNTLLVLNLRLDVVNRVRRLDLKGDGLAGEGLNDCLDVRG